ncbi:polyhydroxyalkanoate biosynthesis repressor PhaR [Alkalihalobacillus sp. BA299]|uniref:polyhydroxyalkanoate biosynthesis repressor PhaR n=1 Tax=Alkalihalobacillus sp. BA299 TaxID=2815938 RepID=UPI001ADCACFC|nr:polyhydroxyalkanoate biosynthesis repressor PhaR [Alkalihalobacillus sp. BA299]
MAENRSYDPYDTFKKFSERWEKQVNDMIHLWTNNTEFVRFSKVNSDAQSRYLEILRKNQDFFATQLNIPTKTDLSNVSKLALQTEEKIDLLEEQIWDLSDSINDTNKEIDGIIKISEDIVKITKQFKTELTKTKKELSENNSLKAELQEVKEELTQLNEIKEELAALKEMLATPHLNNEEQNEEQLKPVLVGENEK